MPSAKQPTLRNFWYATAPVDSLADGPQPFTMDMPNLSGLRPAEATDLDAIVDISRKIEMHMPSDRPGMLMRNRLLALLKAHGEAEASR